MSSPQREPPIAGKLVDALSEEELAAVWRRVERGSAPRSRHRASLAAVAALAVLALVAGGGYALLSGGGLSGEGLSAEGADGASPATAALTRADGSAFVRVGPSERVVLRDRSHIETRDGAIEVLENASGSLALHLQGGRARFAITPGTGRRWRVEAAGVSVDVVGTVFTMERSADAIEVAVERGVVVVRGARVPDGVRRLSAGGSLRVELEPVASVAPAPQREAEPETEATGPSSAERVEPSAPAAEPAPPTARALLEAADVARRAGRREEAIASLTTLVRTHPRSREAPLAAFTVARLQRESGRAGEAAAWYRRALALGLPAPLDEQAREALDGLEDAPE